MLSINETQSLLYIVDCKMHAELSRLQVYKHWLSQPECRNLLITTVILCDISRDGYDYYLPQII